ncbi:ABC-F family ATP-binding cassette domain-containing protein [Clostridium sp. E02]|uniref:ABC-F family ATP-binding cassette domain-containing protein n=1 Tax=Clostridium sp. E02 TaxID=2487134 RepID=UPI000F52CF8C|nr:ABC-F family ATP-binding cassette domain-containing protein [Clostridium sp. E02]
MSLLNITELSHSFGDKQLFHHAEFSLNQGEHVGLVGQNGTGKSTLIRICTSQIVPDAGNVIWQPRICFGYLDQYAQIKKEITMKEFLKTAFNSLYDMEKERDRCYESAAENTRALFRAAEYEEQLEHLGFYQIDSMIDRVVSGLGLLPLGLDRPIEKMSGGQRAKVILAKLLLEKPDVLLLDEPTNFLDKNHILWLEDYLSHLEQAYLVISHDEKFLDKITNRIGDIDQKKILKYEGSFEEFKKKKKRFRETYLRQYNAQQKEIKKTEEFIRKNIAGRKSKMARGRRTQLERLERMEALNQKEIKPDFFFPMLPLSSAGVVTVKHLYAGYEKPVLSDVTFAIEAGEKVVITGFNGVGKTTLLKTILNQLPVIKGTYSISESTVFGYFEQDFTWDNPEKTPIEILKDAYSYLGEMESRRHLAICGITQRLAMQPVKTLSGGEQAKVKLSLLTKKTCNMLVLDEPTNHLDLQAKIALKSALKDFSGTIILVSHEEDFYIEWANRVIDISVRGAN